MALVWIHTLNQGQGHFVLDSKGAYKRDYTRQFQVLSDSLEETEVTILLGKAADNNQLPQLGDTYGVQDQFVRVTDATAQRSSDAYLWDATIKYTIVNIGDGDKPQNQDPNNAADPRNWFSEVSTSTVKRQRPCYFDALGNPIVNSCGVAFDPPPMVDDDTQQIHITRYETSPNLALINKFKNVLNSKPFWGYQGGMLKCLPITWSIERINGFNFSKTTYTIEQASGWQMDDGSIMDWGYKPVDKGYTNLVDKDGNPASSGTAQSDLKQMSTTDFNGRNHQTPQLLNGHGGKLLPVNSAVWVAFAKSDPAPNGNKLSRANGNLVDGYQLNQAQDFTQLNLPDITRFDRIF